MMISFFLIIWDLSSITHSWIKKPASDVRVKVLRVHGLVSSEQQCTQHGEETARDSGRAREVCK